MAVVMSLARQAWHDRGEEGVLEENARLSTRSYPGEERASATLATEEASGQEYEQQGHQVDLQYLLVQTMKLIISTPKIIRMV